MVTKRNSQRSGTTDTTAAQPRPPARRVGVQVPQVEPGTAFGVSIVSCVDRAALEELLSYPDIAGTILGRLDDTTLLIDPGQEHRFEALTRKNMIVVEVTRGAS